MQGAGDLEVWGRKRGRRAGTSLRGRLPGLFLRLDSARSLGNLGSQRSRPQVLTIADPETVPVVHRRSEGDGRRRQRGGGGPLPTVVVSSQGIVPTAGERAQRKQRVRAQRRVALTTTSALQAPTSPPSRLLALPAPGRTAARPRGPGSRTGRGGGNPGMPSPSPAGHGADDSWIAQR